MHENRISRAAAPVSTKGQAVSRTQDEKMERAGLIRATRAEFVRGDDDDDVMARNQFAR